MTVGAQEHASTLVFPGVARTAGVGTSQWVTDLTVHNLLSEPVSVGLQFFPENHTNTFDASFPHRIDLGSRETKVIEDVLAEVFEYDSDIKGFLIVTVESNFISENSEEANIAGVTRTYNVADPLGTYGQTVNSLPAYASTAAPLVVTGARQGASFRSNLGVVSLTFFDTVGIHYRVLGPDGTTVVEGEKTIPALSLRQWSFSQLGIGSIEGALTVEIRLDEDSISEDPCGFGAGTILAYISKVDNGTGDAEYIPAYRIEGDPCDK